MDTQPSCQKVNTAPRNYGIDLLRIVAMLYIVVLHVLGLGGVVGAAAKGSAQYYVSWFAQMWVYCAVDVFALISGYVGFTQEKKRYQYASFPVMWLQVVVLSVGAMLVSSCFHPETFSLKALIRMCLPVTANTYWYFTAYVPLFFMIPLLNTAVRFSGETHLRRLLVVLVALFCVYSTLGDRWRLFSGFSFLWLMVLYLMGAIMKKCDFGGKMSQKTAFFGIVVCTALSWCWKLYENSHGFLLGNSMVEQTYLTPTHLLSAMLHLVLFSRLQLGQLMKKFLSFAAPGAFAVYILNCHPAVMEGIVVERFARFAGEPVALLCLRVLGFSIAFVAVSLVIDWARRKLFALCRVRTLAQKAVDLTATVMDVFTSRWMG